MYYSGRHLIAPAPCRNCQHIFSVNNKDPIIKNPSHSGGLYGLRLSKYPNFRWKQIKSVKAQSVLLLTILMTVLMSVLLTSTELHYPSPSDLVVLRLIS